MKRILLILASAILVFGCQKEVYHNITVSVNPAEGGTVSPSSGPVLDGTSVSFKATPKSDYVFTGWSGSISGTENPKTLTVTQDMNVTANFTLRSYPLTITIEGDGTVAERIISTKSEYQSGTVVELIATPSDHWLFDHWEGDLSGSEMKTQITVSSDKIVKAVFVERMYPLTVEVVGNGYVQEKIIETKSSYKEGTIVELTAVSDECWFFDHWEGDANGQDNPTVIIIDKNTKVKAIFIEDQFTNLAKAGTANCYVVNSEGYYKIPTVKGNSNNKLEGAVSAKIIWETYNQWGEIKEGDLISELEYKDGFLYFYIPMHSDFGNANIGVLDAADNILWSWHIWICKDFVPENEQISLPNSGIIMDRNIGASAASYSTQGAGMLYQWGRKDPFFISQWDWMADRPDCMSTIGPSPTVTAEDIITGSDNLVYSIQHPEVFITNEYSPYDWYTTDIKNINDKLWNDNGGKTVYDPCPAGWKVPCGGVEGIWAKNNFDRHNLILPGYDENNYPFVMNQTDGWWDRSEKGRYLASSMNWFNMAGCKTYFDGKQIADGGYGAYWTSYTDDICAEALYFAHYGDIYPQALNIRSYGYSVRCEKE